MSVQGTMTQSSGATVETRASTRSTAMWMLPALAAAELLLFINVLRDALIPPVVVSAVIMALVLLAVVARPGRWSYLAGTIGFLLVTAGNGPIIIDGIIHPIASAHQWTEAIALVVATSGCVAGIAAFLEARGSVAAVPAFRAPLGDAAVALLIGLLVGGTVIGLNAYSEAQANPGAGVANGVSSAPTQPGVELTATGSKFTQQALELHPGAGVVYVVNHDNSPHTFDYDLNGKHFSHPVPASSTVAVVINLKAGQYTYWCALSGHRANGMEGTLKVS